MKIASLSVIGSGLVLAACLQGAYAQTKPAKVVTRDELRACMNSESDLSTRRKALEGRSAKNGEEVAAIRAEAAELTEERDRLERDQKPMERFERKVKAHNARIAAARTSGDALRADMEALNASLGAHNDKCGGISFLPEDKEAILKEREGGATK